MGKYGVGFNPSAYRELKKVPSEIKNILKDKIKNLSDNPRPYGSRRLKNKRGEYRRIRQGDYRAVYEIDRENLTVSIVKIGHRREVYELL